MKNIIAAIRSLTQKGQNNGIKILSLGVGLAMGLVLVSKIYFEQSFDDFYPDSERIYKIESNYSQESLDKTEEYPYISGAIAPGMKSEVSEVEVATRFTYIGGDLVFYTSNRNKYKGIFILADSCLFDVLPRPMIVGNAKEILSRPDYAIISQKIAKNIGKGRDVVGESITLDMYPGKTMTIGGIFEDIPENSYAKYDIIVSLSSISNFFRDGRDNWLGNERYLGFVKLYPGVSPESLAPAFRNMQEKYQDIESIEKKGMYIHYTLKEITSLHKDDPETKKMTLLLSLLAFALMFTAVMNYVLIVISSLVSRSKVVAIRKCYGASDKNISSMILSETFVHLTISLLVSIILILVFRSTVEEILATSLSALFTLRSIVLLILVCLVVFFLAGMIPSYLFVRIPVGSAFRTFKESRRIWKLGLLFVQFIAAAFLVTLLVVIGRQYNLMVNDNPGFNYDNLVYVNVSGIDSKKTENVLNELRRLPEVVDVSTSSSLLIDGAPGNNVSLPGDDKDLFNIADLEYVDENFLNIMEIPILEGKGFNREMPETPNMMLVSQSFVDKMALLAGWTDGVIGKTVNISYHGLSVICGVYPNIRYSSIQSTDQRASIMIFNKRPNQNIIIKLDQLDSDNIQKVTQVIENIIPDKDVVVTPYVTSMVDIYRDSLLFRNSVMIGGFVTLLITLIGLIGYTNDEINRRKAEVAVRKINGATTMNIQRLFLTDILTMAIPAMIFGGIAAYFAATKWQTDFTVKSDLSFILFILCGVVVLAIILGVVIFNCYRAANDNPVNSLKNS